MALLLNNFPELLCFQSFEEALPFCHAVKLKADLDKTARPKEIFNLPTNRSGTDIDKQSSVVSEK